MILLSAVNDFKTKKKWEIRKAGRQTEKKKKLDLSILNELVGSDGLVAVI